MVDATGSGDVDTSRRIDVSSIASDHIVTSPLTGHKLLIDPEWLSANQGQHFQIGSIRAYDFFPKPLVKRLEKKRTTKFNEKMAKSLAALRLEIEAKTKQFESAPEDVSAADKKAMKEQVEDAQALCDAVAKETNSGSGPVFDVLAWNDGKKWVAVLNTVPMTPYVDCADLDEAAESKAEDQGDGTEDSLVMVAKDANGHSVYDVTGWAVLAKYVRRSPESPQIHYENKHVQCSQNGVLYLSTCNMLQYSTIRHFTSCSSPNHERRCTQW